MIPQKVKEQCKNPFNIKRVLESCANPRMLAPFSKRSLPSYLRTQLRTGNTSKFLKFLEFKRSPASCECEIFGITSRFCHDLRNL